MHLGAQASVPAVFPREIPRQLGSRQGCLRSQVTNLEVVAMTCSRSILSLAAFVLGIIVTAGAHPQTITATLEGRATDSSGAAVAGANVTAVNSSTGLSRSAVSSDSGEYRISLLPVGEYTVTVEHQGFRRDSKKVSLEIGQTATL